MIDNIESDILHQGTVVIKQPDVWSQARMTKFRKEFEDTMAQRLTTFTPMLAARIARSDAATFQSQTALGAVLTPFGTPTNGTPFTPQITSQTELNTALSNTTGLLTTPAAAGTTSTGQISAVPGIPSPLNTPQADFNLLTRLATPASAPTSTSPTTNMTFGLEPNVQLDQEADYITRLHRLRRVNLGDDIADSAGYGLYLLRVPVSIQPGDRTVKGHGAVVTLTMQHDFGPRFLASTYRNLVINDLIDKLSGPIHELIRSGQVARIAAVLVQAAQSIEEINHHIRIFRESTERALASTPKNDPKYAKLNQLVALARKFEPLPDLEIKLDPYSHQQLIRAITPISNTISEIYQLNPDAGKGLTKSYQAPTDVLPDSPDIKEAYGALNSLRLLAIEPSAVQPGSRSGEGKRRDDGVVPPDRDGDQVEGAPTGGDGEAGSSDTSTRPIRKAMDDLRKFIPQALQDISQFSTPTSFPLSRAGSRVNAIAPTDLPNVIGRENMLKLAVATMNALDLGTRIINNQPFTPEQGKVQLTAVRSFLKHELEAAYDIVEGGDKEQIHPILMDVEYVESIVDAVKGRKFEGPKTTKFKLNDPDNDLGILYEGFTNRLPGNLNTRGLGVLTWAVVIEAGLLNRQLRQDMTETKGEGYTCPPDVEGMHFYTPIALPETEFAFQAYIKARWPMITFALEPVTDQQNVEDAFTRRRDLQLAVAFALSSGRISFRQAIQFTRQLQYEAQTIALNQTVTAFAFANDTFGWRFTPRYQTPPEESNIQAITNMLGRGGPGPNYQIRHSKLEPGLREQTAVVVMPSFVRGLRLDVSTDWFKLADPDDRKIHTARTVELGRRINEARQCLAAAHSCGLYRAEDVQRLGTRLLQLERMLPMQTSHVQVPYENTLGGFALFTQGATALVPQLTGFEGIEYLNREEGAEILVYGKNFSIYEMEVVVGGKSLLREGAGTATLAGSDNKTRLIGTAITPLRVAENKLLLIRADGTTIEVKDTGTYNIVSREVLRVRIPPNVNVSTLGNGRKVVELFVSTPNGISNRLQIPLAPDPARERPAIGTPAGPARFTFVDNAMTVRLESYVEGGQVKVSKVVPFTAPASIRLQHIGGRAPEFGALNLQLEFEVPNRSRTVTQSLDLRGVRRNGEFYFLDADHLNQIAERLKQLIELSELATMPESVKTKLVLVEPVPQQGGPAVKASPTSDQLTVDFEYVLIKKPPAAAASQGAGAGGTSVAVAAPADAVRPASHVAFGDAAARKSGRDPMMHQATPDGERPALRPAAFLQDGVAAPVPPSAPATAPTGPIQVQLTLPPLPASAASGLATALGAPAAPALPLPPAQTLVVVPPSRPATVNVAVPINNATKRQGLFHREPPTPANPARRSVLQRMRGEF